jgi:POT family proton-dependent oligopeptide transporter
MTDTPTDDATNRIETQRIPNPITELVHSFRALKGAPRAFWYTNYAYWMDGVAYFGMLTLLTMFFHDVAGLPDDVGHELVSVYMALITGTMLIFGPLTDRLGVRRSLIISIVLYIIGRSALPLAPGFFQPGSTAILVFCLIALVVAATGNGFMQPSCYAGVRKFSDQKTAAMGYGLLYAGMNLGIVLIGIISPRIRTGIHIGGWNWGGWGIKGVFWFCIAVNVLMLLMVVFRFTSKSEREGESAANAAAEDTSDEERTEEQQTKTRRSFGSDPWGAVVAWLKGNPLANARFSFFIFILLPVQTLFAYQFLVMPQYVTRAFSQIVADNMESVVNIINPLIIVLGVPIITAMTRKVPVYRMMIIGALVSALPTFFFMLGPKFPLLMTYFVLFSLGEAMWQPRFLQFAAELAPKGRTGAYIAYANIPWFMVKALAGLYTGRMMERYCPAQGPQNTETMWLVYAIIAMVSPVGLVLARKWVLRGWHAAGDSGDGSG